jgi:hypothetical protein
MKLNFQKMMFHFYVSILDKWMGSAEYGQAILEPCLQPSVDTQESWAQCHMPIFPAFGRLK